MTIRIIALVLPAAVGSFVIGAASEPHPSARPTRCSLIPAVSFRDTTVTAVLGSALPDTIFAGPGSVVYSNYPGHWGDGRRDAFFAQLVDVARLAGADSQALEAHFAQHGDRRIALVPWDYAPDCRPVPWSRSARWVEDGNLAFYRLQLRAPAEWARGYPTFDVLAADLQPYPHGLFWRRGYRNSDSVRAGLGLTATEYFDLYAVLPTREESDGQSAAAFARLDAWLIANPSIAQRYPATLTLRLLRRPRQNPPPPPANESLEPTGRPAALPRPELRPGRPAAHFRR
jgi:hypothetical protein